MKPTDAILATVPFLASLSSRQPKGLRAYLSAEIESIKILRALITMASTR